MRLPDTSPTSGARKGHLLQSLHERRSLDDRTRVRLALDTLRQNRMLSAAYVRPATRSGGVPPALFGVLVALGRGDLSIARLFEGHVNALQLIARFGTDGQCQRAQSVADAGGLLGIWGADDPTHPGQIATASGRPRLAGRKTYASGADIVELALLAVKESGATQLVLVDREALRDRLDPAWWRAIGMQATNSYAVHLDGLAVAPDDLVGLPSVYEAQPFFGAGAIRFVAAQLGGALAVWDATVDHLRQAGRHQDAHQAARLGQLVAELEAAYCFVRDAYSRVASAIEWDVVDAPAELALAADAARVAMAETAERTLTVAIRAVGCAGLMEDHPLARVGRDLMVYLRQPAPDAALVRVGIGAAAHSYRPVFDAD